MIPAMLHRIWIQGWENIPDEFQDYWETWNELHPGWEFRTWSEDELRWLTNQDLYDAADNPAQKADIARYEVLRRYGGVYVDCDIEPLRPIDELLGHRAFAVWEDGEYVCNAVLGCEPEHPLIAAIVDELPASMSSHRREPINMQSGPPYITEIARRDGWDGFVILPAVRFYPYTWKQKDPGPPYPASSYAVHHWRKSWA